MQKPSVPSLKGVIRRDDARLKSGCAARNSSTRSSFSSAKSEQVT